MKLFTRISLVFIFLTALGAASPDLNFDNFFIDSTLRIDYFHIGDADSEIITLDQVRQYGVWAGSRTNLRDEFNNGRYYVKIFDVASGKLIFSRGFDSYFGEYQTSGQAARGVKRTYHESARIPCPRSAIRFVLERRDRLNKLNPIFQSEIDPQDIQIIRDRVLDPSIKIVKSLSGGDPHSCVDIAILGEGYTSDQTAKFTSDLERVTSLFVKYEPYRSLKQHFNIYGVLKPSEESGVDEPRAGIFKQTSLNASFNALGSERYLLTEDNRSLQDIAAHVPYDAVMIMVNHERYGGGGIYNSYCTFTADTQFHEYIFIHEFGHSFAGLADEYYTSAVAYNDFYPKGLEPNEPNITALLDPADLKWKQWVKEGTEVPTPWEKQAFDSMDTAWQKQRAEMNDRIARLKKDGAPASEIRAAEQKYARRDREHSEHVDAYLQKSRFLGKVGAFEGAGYAAQGLYRPMLDCIMFTKGSKPFCTVCEAAVLRVIQHYRE
jgi:hypothetical protein